MGVTVDGKPRLGEKGSRVAGPEDEIVRGTPGDSYRAVDTHVCGRSDLVENPLGRFLRRLGRVAGSRSRGLLLSVFGHGRVRGLVLPARPGTDVGAVSDDIGLAEIAIEGDPGFVRVGEPDTELVLAHQ